MTMAAAAFAELREAIVMGDIGPGTSLPLERLAKVLGMSISPVREALRKLESQGLVEATPYRGARVSEISADEMADIYEAREALEVLAARRAAQRFGDRERERLGTILDDLGEAYSRGDVRSIVRGNSLFHAALAEISGSHTLPRLLQPTLEASERFTAAILLTGEISKPIHEIEAAGHRAIVAACERSDPDGAEAAVRDHLRTFEELFVGHRGATK